MNRTNSKLKAHLQDLDATLGKLRNTGQSNELILEALEISANCQQMSAETESQLADTRARLEHFIEFAPLSIYIKDEHLSYQLMNNTGLETLGKSEQDVIGKTDFELFPAPVARRINKREKQVLETGRTIQFDGVLPLDNDDRYYFSATLFPIDRDDKIIGLIGLVEDHTELHTSERALSQQKEELSEARSFLRGVLENSQDIIFLTKPTGKIISINNGAVASLGYTNTEATEKYAKDLAVDSQQMTELFNEAFRNGHSNCFEIKLRRRDGNEVIGSLSLTTITDQFGHIVEVAGICRDITNRLKLQEDLIQTERLAAIGKMAAGVAHEINNPLAIIEMISGVIDETLVDAEIDNDSRSELREAVDSLLLQTRRCASITHSLLGFSRKSKGAKILVKVTDILDELVALMRPELRRIDVTISKDFTKNLPLIETDVTLLEQVLVNLVRNALDAIEERAPDSPYLGITAELCEDPDEGARIAITISDNGIGIEEDNLNQIFDLFYTSKPPGKGTGLGLSIVHNILNKLGGDISVESELGVGTSFTLMLPIHS
ncbi:MAG: PAS domain S-box protein [bacterium]|nr:PAS domain S-box protein [bacterium]MCP4801116.1 PAS domain S-box protein [bacterium]